MFQNLTSTICLILFLALNPSYAETVRLTTHNLAPYSYYENDKLIGKAVIVVECAFKQLNNFEAEFIVVPWKRAQQMVEKNEAEGFFAASHNPQRDEYAVISEIIAEQKWTWYMLTERIADPTSDTFKQNYIVSSFLGANMQKWLNQQGFKLVNQLPSTNLQLFKLLMHKRVDAILANDQVMNKLITEKNAADKISTIINRNKPLGVYFSKAFIQKNPKFLPSFNQAVLNCRS